MTEEQIKQNAEEWVKPLIGEEDGGYNENDVSLSLMKNAYIAGAHSRDEEIGRMNTTIRLYANHIAHLREELDQLRDPWISVEDRLPEKGQACFLADFNKRRCGYGKFYTDDGMAARWECKEGDSAKIYLLHAVTHWMLIPQIEKEEV